jgi:hypothetical protein
MVQTGTSRPFVADGTPTVPSLFGTSSTPATTGTPAPVNTPTPALPPATPVAKTVGVSVSTFLTGSFAAEPMGFYTDTTVCIGYKACDFARGESRKSGADVGNWGDPAQMHGDEGLQKSIYYKTPDELPAK